MSSIPSSLPPPPVGHTNVGQSVQVMDLTAESQASRAAHDAVKNQLLIQKIAASLTSVPTLPHDVQSALRDMGLPVRLFGEGLAEIRQRLRLALASQEFRKQQQGIVDSTTGGQHEKQAEEEEQVTKYTRASPDLLEARQLIARFSLNRAKIRMDRERKLREMALLERHKKRKMNPEMLSDHDDDDIDAAKNELYQLNESFTNTRNFLSQVALEGSQYGDARVLSSICTCQMNGEAVAVTGSWTSSVHVWQVPGLTMAGHRKLCHEDRIMDMDLICPSSSSEKALLATASVDLTAKLFQIKPKGDVVMKEEDEEGDTVTEVDQYNITELVLFKGHQARLCRIAFHPMQQHVGTTSFDHTWRLWDMETGTDLLLQDGHAAAVFGLAFHPDGSVCATSDFASVVQLWDLRTGKSICRTAPGTGHAKRILCAAFAPNGFHWATAGDDGTIMIWDLRRRGKRVVSIPAHSRLVSKLVYEKEGGDYLASSSFDGTAKLWSTRTDWKLLNTLRGHEDKVSSVDLVPGGKGIVTCGFDKTFKFWS